MSAVDRFCGSVAARLDRLADWLEGESSLTAALLVLFVCGVILAGYGVALVVTL